MLVCPEKSRPEENKDKALLTYTHAVDIWAMGILAFECLSGKPPFERQSRTETYEYIMYRRQQCPTYFSQEAVDFVHHALSKARPLCRLLVSRASEVLLQLLLLTPTQLQGSHTVQTSRLTVCRLRCRLRANAPR